MSCRLRGGVGDYTGMCGHRRRLRLALCPPSSFCLIYSIAGQEVGESKLFKWIPIKFSLASRSSATNKLLHVYKGEESENGSRSDVEKDSERSPAARWPGEDLQLCMLCRQALLQYTQLYFEIHNIALHFSFPVFALHIEWDTLNSQTCSTNLTSDLLSSFA